MCLALPAKVTKVNGMNVFVEYNGEEKKALSGGVDIEVGDYVLIQMGIVVKRISSEEASLAEKSWNNIQ